MKEIAIFTLHREPFDNELILDLNVLIFFALTDYFYTKLFISLDISLIITNNNFVLYLALRL